MSAAMSSGVCIASPSTAKPPELMTATATSLQCVKAMTGNSIPSMSQSFVRSGSLAMLELPGSPSAAAARNPQ